VINIDFDSAKNDKNILERDLSFERVQEFDFETATFTIDDRFDYGETRIRALGLIEKRLYALVFVEIDSGIRVISFRKANKREMKHYENKS
jgi:uncharacterized DUF497 family protein